MEIDILHEFSHKNIIQLYDAFFFDSKLWVSKKWRKITRKYRER